LVGYFTVSAIHAENYQVSDIPVDKLPHFNYAFAGVSTSGECIPINP
jgi:GH18 family chitinase